MSTTTTTIHAQLRKTTDELSAAANAGRLTTEQLIAAVNLLDVRSEYSPKSCGLNWLRDFVDTMPGGAKRLRAQVDVRKVYWECTDNPCIAELFESRTLLELVEKSERSQFVLAGLRSMVHVTTRCFLDAKRHGARDGEIAQTLQARLTRYTPSVEPRGEYFSKTFNIFLRGAGGWATNGRKDGRMQWTFNAENGVWSLFGDDELLYELLVHCAQIVPEQLLNPKQHYAEQPTFAEQLASRFGNRDGGKELISNILFEAARAMPKLTTVPPEVLLGLLPTHQRELIKRCQGCSLPYLVRKAAELPHGRGLFDEFVTGLCNQAMEALPEIFAELQPFLADMPDREFAQHINRALAQRLLERGSDFLIRAFCLAQPFLATTEHREFASQLDELLLERLGQLSCTVAVLAEGSYKGRRRLEVRRVDGRGYCFTYIEDRTSRDSEKRRAFRAGDFVIFDRSKSYSLAKGVYAVEFTLVPARGQWVTR